MTLNINAPSPAEQPVLADVPSVTDQTVHDLVSQIDSRGFACLPGYISEVDLAAMRAFVSAAVAKSNGEYVGFTGRAAVAGSVFDRLASSDAFRSLITRIYEVGTGKAAPPSEFYQVLRCLTGQSGQRHALNFHYDSYVVTAFIPVDIPTTGKTGDLVMLPNTRRIRNTYLANVIDKVLLDNKLTQVILKTLMTLRMLPLVRIRPVPGNLYFFWGYRSIHTNEACDPDKVRATALYHFANPHAGDRLNAKLRQPAMA